jgi:hypothetical protein
MVTLAIFAFNFAHPGFLLYRAPKGNQLDGGGNGEVKV